MNVKYPTYGHEISGLPRQCPKCNLIAHYEVATRKLTLVKCPECDYKFCVKKYSRGERVK